MNRIKSLICLSLMLVMGGQMMAQTHGTMFLGASFPMGNFNKVDGYYSTALYGGQDAKFGGAGLGFNAGLKWDFGLGVPGLAVVLSVDGFYNGNSGDMKECYKDYASGYDLLNRDIEQKYAQHINVPVMLGMRYTYYFNPQLGLYAEGEVGGNGRFITPHVMKYTSLLGVKHTDTERFNTAFTFAWQAGLGLEVSKNLVVGCSFYNLGSSEVKGTETLKSDQGKVENDFEHGTLRPMMLLARIGFRF